MILREPKCLVACNLRFEHAAPRSQWAEFGAVVDGGDFTSGVSDAQPSDSSVACYVSFKSGRRDLPPH